jgi:hypothetical protein
MSFLLRLRSLLALGLFAVATGSSATTVVEKDLDALCAEADRVFVGTVSAIESRWTDPQHNYIETLVTFDHLDPLFGVDSSAVVLRFAGGRIGDLVQHVQGLPQFAEGERVVIFARDGATVSPLVGFHQGCLRLQGDGETTAVVTDTYERVGTRNDGRHVITESSAASAAVPLHDFLDDVRQRLALRRGSPQ